MERIYVYTGLGLMDLKEFLDICAGDAGYGSYAEAYRNGWRHSRYEHITPEDLK